MQLAGRQHEEALEAALKQAYLRYPEMFLYMDFLTDEPINEELVYRTVMEALALREENNMLHYLRGQEIARAPMLQMRAEATQALGDSKGKGKGKGKEDSSYQSFTAFAGIGQTLGS